MRAFFHSHLKHIISHQTQNRTNSTRLVHTFQAHDHNFPLLFLQQRILKKAEMFLVLYKFSLTTYNPFALIPSAHFLIWSTFRIANVAEAMGLKLI